MRLEAYSCPVVIQAISTSAIHWLQSPGTSLQPPRMSHTHATPCPNVHPKMKGSLVRTNGLLPNRQSPKKGRRVRIALNLETTHLLHAASKAGTGETGHPTSDIFGHLNQKLRLVFPETLLIRRPYFAPAKHVPKSVHLPTTLRTFCRRTTSTAATKLKTRRTHSPRRDPFRFSAIRKLIRRKFDYAAAKR